MADKKPDLSDLKARLGLTKPGPTSGPPAGPPGAAGSSPAGGPPVAAGPPGASGAPTNSGPAYAGPPSAGPPAGGPAAFAATSAGPPPSGPPTAGPPSAGPRARTGTAPPRSSAPAASGAPMSSAGVSVSMDIPLAPGDTRGLESGKSFSVPVIGAMAVCFVVGMAIMWAAMSSVNANALVAMQEEDAINVRDAVKPKVQNFQELAQKITTMDPNAPDGALATELAAADFVVPGAILSTVRVPLPGSVTDSVAGYAADSYMLKALLDEHVRLTNKADKEELEQILKGNEAVQNNKAFAVMFDHQDVVKNSKAEDYQPKRGRLVGVRDFKDETKKYEIEFLGSGNLGEVDPQQIIPIDTAQILKSSGQNALSRYQFRVRNLRFHATKMANYTPNLLDSLDSAASGEPAGGAAEAPAEAAPAPEPEPEPEPAAEPEKAEEPAEAPSE